MIAFIVALCLGAAEMLLLKKLLGFALKGDMKKTVLFVFLKLALYGAVIAVIMLLLKSQLKWAAIGFSVGLPGAAIVSTLFSLKKETAPTGEKADKSADSIGKEANTVDRGGNH